MTDKTFLKASAAEPCCVACGKAISNDEILSCLEGKVVPACQEHYGLVREEMWTGLPMWPSGWYGHCSKDCVGHWRVQDEDGGLYEWPITSH